MIHKIKMDNSTKAELRLTKKQEYILEPLPESTKQKLYKLIIEKAFEQSEKSKEISPEKLLSEVAQGNLEDIREPFIQLFDDLFKNLKCLHCRKQIIGDKNTK